ncbi:MAG: NAD(+) synthase, partial [Clostridiales bacterium]|nr:NAD(+) synthase [Clostridiales bacterium]
APFADNELTVADIDTAYLLFERARNTTVRFGYKEGERQLTVVQLPAWSGALRRNVPRTPFVPQADCSETAELILTIQAEGLRKRMQHTGLSKLVLGVSGGLDSALALLVCLRALDAQKLPRKNLIALSMPGFGTSEQTAQNALALAAEAKADRRVIDIVPSVTQHLADIGHDLSAFDAAYENAQARMRTVIVMDIANRSGGIAVGTGDLSEAALGWCTYNGDHMSMYGVNASVPKTLVKFLVAYEAKRLGGKMQAALEGVLATDISPELLPAKEGKISQKTEDIIGSFEQNDFFLYYAVRRGCTPQVVLLYAAAAFGGKPRDYADALARFYKRFFASQFKRSCSPDGAAVGFSLSPRGAWRMPSDADVNLWLKSIENGAKDI